MEKFIQAGYLKDYVDRERSESRRRNVPTIELPWEQGIDRQPFQERTQKGEAPR
ncbi:UNVERIFIED_CONTAM: hypothetical protein Sradi_4392400 [Sesamum radiatum]|uniref:Uncharacterized protein n=1 Tax=Sesamum radiatum TaxID=300843 RepID=A0AAW2NSW8_SESRA